MTVKGEYLDTLKGEYLDTLKGAIPLPEAMPTVWVLEDSDEDRAKEILAAHAQKAAAEGSDVPWTCEGCGEEHASQFGACWKCGGGPP